MCDLGWLLVLPLIWKVLRDIILASDQHSIADSFSALMAGTRKVSPLVQKMKIFKDNRSQYDMYRLSSKNKKQKQSYTRALHWATFMKEKSLFIGSPKYSETTWFPRREIHRVEVYYDHCRSYYPNFQLNTTSIHSAEVLHNHKICLLRWPSSTGLISTTC